MPAPIFVTSPTTRAGTTLLQRLITSSENGVCYGEFAGRRIAHLCEYAHNEILLIQKNERKQAREWADVLKGNVDYWMVGLDLPGDFAKHALVGMIQFYRQHYDEATKLIEKDVWAVKSPTLEFTKIARMADLINDLKCIYVYRNIYEVIRSQKTKGWLTSREKLVEACTEWVTNTQVIAALKKKNFENLPAMLHVIEYEDLVLNLDRNIRAIEAFCGLRGIKPEVAEKKVNTWVEAPENGNSGSAFYQEPAALTTDEIMTIGFVCGNRMQELYPDFETPTS
jgi:hypothetical protein